MSDDRSLAVRILATLAAVLLVDLLFVAVVASLLRPYLLALPGIAESTLPLAQAGTFAVVLAAFVWLQLHYARRETLASVDAEVVTREDYPDLHTRITRLSELADVATPTLAVADTDVPNSFTVGGLGRGTVVVSTGLLETLDGDELDAVLAHELAHLRNHDAVVMTLASFLPALVGDDYSLREAYRDAPVSVRAVALGLGAVGVVALGATFVRQPLLAVAILAAAVVLGGVALGLLAAPVVYLSRSLSRSRELVADRDAAHLTGSPTALADALVRLDDDVAAAPRRDKREQYAGVDGLCLLPYGFSLGEEEGDDGFRVETRSHPSTDQRIERLQALAADQH